jgi:hypothetical protein
MGAAESTPPLVRRTGVRACAKIAHDLNVPLKMPAFDSGGYDGPLAYRMGRPMRDGSNGARRRSQCS